MADPTTMQGLVGDPSAVPPQTGVAPPPQVENMGPGNTPPQNDAGGTETTMPSNPNMATMGNVVSGVNVGSEYDIFNILY